MQTRLSANQSARTILVILYLSIQVSFRAVHKEIYKKMHAVTLNTQKSPLGANLSFSHTHIGLSSKGVGIPVTFVRESPSWFACPFLSTALIDLINTNGQLALQKFTSTGRLVTSLPQPFERRESLFSRFQLNQRNC